MKHFIFFTLALSIFLSDVSFAEDMAPAAPVDSAAAPAPEGNANPNLNPPAESPPAQVSKKEDNKKKRDIARHKRKKRKKHRRHRHHR